MKHVHDKYAVWVEDYESSKYVQRLFEELGYRRGLVGDKDYPKFVITKKLPDWTSSGFVKRAVPFRYTVLSIEDLLEMVKDHKGGTAAHEYLRQSKLKNFYELTYEPTDICIPDGATQYIQGVSNPDRKGWLKNGKFWDNGGWIMHSDRQDEYTVLWDRNKDIILPTASDAKEEAESLSLQQVFEALANGGVVQVYIQKDVKGNGFGEWFDLHVSGISVADMFKNPTLLYRIKPDFALLNDIKVDKPTKVVTDAITGSVGLVYGDLDVAEKNKKLLESLFGM